MKNTRSERVKNADFLRWTQGADNSEQKSRLRRNLRLAREQALTSRQRQILSMYYEQEMRVIDIAEALSVTPSTVSRTLARACRRLHAALQYSF